MCQWTFASIVCKPLETAPTSAGACALPRPACFVVLPDGRRSQWYHISASYQKMLEVLLSASLTSCMGCLDKWVLQPHDPGACAGVLSMGMSTAKSSAKYRHAFLVHDHGNSQVSASANQVVIAAASGAWCATLHSMLLCASEEEASTKPPPKAMLLKPKDVRASLTGKWLQLFWPDDGRWWPGQVVDINVKKHTALLLYETGRCRLLLLAGQGTGTAM